MYAGYTVLNYADTETELLHVNGESKIVRAVTCGIKIGSAEFAWLLSNK